MKRTGIVKPTPAQPAPTLAIFCLDAQPEGRQAPIAASLGPEARISGSLDDALGGPTDGAVLVLLTDPVDSLARALGAGDDSAAVWARWLDARQLLAARLRRARRRMTLLDTGGLSGSEAGALWAEVVQRCGIKGGPALPELAPAAAPDAPYRAAAIALLKSDASAGALLDELAASTLGGCKGPEALDTVTSLLGDWRALGTRVEQLQEGLALHSESERILLGKLDAAHSDPALLKENNALQMSEMERVHEALSQSTASGVQTARQLDARTAELARLTAELDTSTRALAEAKAGTERLSRDLAQAVSARDEAQRRTGKDRKRMAALEDSLTLHRENLALQADQSLQLASSLKDQRAEIASLTERLGEMLLLKATNEALEHELTEAHENTRRRTALLGAQILGDAAAARAAAEELGATQAERDALQAEVDRLQNDNAALNDELTRVYRSASWRATGVVRAARHRIGPKRAAQPPEAKN